MFTKSVDSILNSFAKISLELDKLVENEGIKIEKYKKDIGVLQNLVDEGVNEVERAHKVRKNLQQLTAS